MSSIDYFRGNRGNLSPRGPERQPYRPSPDQPSDQISLYTIASGVLTYKSARELPSGDIELTTLQIQNDKFMAEDCVAAWGPDGIQQDPGSKAILSRLAKPEFVGGQEYFYGLTFPSTTDIPISGYGEVSTNTSSFTGTNTTDTTEAKQPEYIPSHMISRLLLRGLGTTSFGSKISRPDKPLHQLLHPNGEEGREQSGREIFSQFAAYHIPMSEFEELKKKEKRRGEETVSQKVWLPGLRRVLTGLSIRSSGKTESSATSHSV